ncbi:GAF and ANTAR domain-containing protein [Nocardioides sp.]|uniref:GAF and ANTAR domain-containing protein n=1 Tax=Nocardioides sp. TaxID=35761 RepID=UPI0035B25DDB
MTSTNQRMGEFSRLAQDLAATEDETARLQLAVDSAVLLVERCAHACISINEKGRNVIRVGSDDVARRANELQYEVGEGPCLDVRREQVALVCADLATERRYPSWARRAAADLEVGSMMSLLVYTDDDAYGCLSLYADRGVRFDADDVAVGETLAAHLAVTLAAGREIHGLGLALNSRLVIGRAEGILMERLGISEDQALDYLRRVSSHTNRKLVAVCEEIVRTRELPEA